MATYGYCRISTPKQNLDRQIRNIKREFPDAVIYQESYTGTKLDRPEWNKLMRKVRPGDSIVFDSVSRMSRNAEDGFALYTKLYEMGTNLVFLKEPMIDTAVYREAAQRAVPMTGTEVDVILKGVNQYLFLLAEKQIALAFVQAQKEIDDLHQRTKEGIETARRNGKSLGRPGGKTYVTDKEKKALPVILRTSKDFQGHNTDREVMLITGLSRNTYYKYKQKLRTHIP
jgi:DNA invertase Pin-like site-specific DNA recombinase